MINWEQQFATNNKKIDQLNKRMIETINYLFKPEHFQIDELFNMLIFYSRSQFAIEESFIEYYEVRNGDHHTQEHRHFINTIRSHHIEYSKGDQQIVEKTKSFLSLWAYHHIASVDTKSYKFAQLKQRSGSELPADIKSKQTD